MALKGLQGNLDSCINGHFQTRVWSIPCVWHLRAKRKQLTTLTKVKNWALLVALLENIALNKKLAQAGVPGYLSQTDRLGKKDS
eukprot:323760-Pelagomonas_calceolata.AAC.1